MCKVLRILSCKIYKRTIFVSGSDNATYDSTKQFANIFAKHFTVNSSNIISVDLPFEQTIKSYFFSSNDLSIFCSNYRTFQETLKYSKRCTY